MLLSIKTPSDLLRVIGRTRCEQPLFFRRAPMFRWLIVVFLALIVFSRLQPWLAKIGFGRLPGDFRFRLFGREWFIPLASSVVISVLGMLIGKLF
jgi:hypothetical protein